MSGFSNYLVTKTGYLVRTFIRSFNYVAGVSGWTINKDGSAEFNNVTIRGGEIIGGTQLSYNGTPALGNLIGSVSELGGTDAEGNAYLPGLVSYVAAGGGYQASQLFGGEVAFQANTTYGGAYTYYGSIDNGIYGSDSSVQFNLLGSVAFVFIGPIVSTSGTPSLPTLITTDTWHTAALQNSWTGTAQYTMRPDGTVALRTLGSLGAGTITDATTLFTLPSAYQPANAQIIPCIISAVGDGSTATGDSPYLQIGTNGAVDVFGIATQVATNIRFAGAYSLT